MKKLIKAWLIPFFLLIILSIFTAVPGGMRSEKGHCTDMAFTGYWWTSMELPNSIAYSIQLYIPYVVSIPRTPQGFQVIGKKRGLSVRCIRD